MARSEAIANIDLTSLTDEGLEELLTKVQTAFEERVQSRMAEFRRIASRAGYEVSLSKIAQMVGHGRGQRTSSQSAMRGQRQPVLPKYRNPDNPAESWSGRGHRPRWLEAQLAAGKTLAELEITSAQ
ncbi:MAG: H-NS histone family protein [Acidobacteria bacterium]|nr:H-NS histone family protein [Acidobacteriota bacterium]